MGLATFNRLDLIQIITASAIEKGVEPELVSDDGIYLLARRKNPKKNVVVYSNECNPKLMEFDDWWETKRSISGSGDDWCNTIPKNWIRVAVGNDCNLGIEISETELSCRFICSITGKDLTAELTRS